MKNKIPKGILILAILCIISSLISIKEIFTSNNLIFFGYLLYGVSFKVYYSLIALLGIVISIGLFKLKKWAFVIFIIENIFFIIMFLFNMFLITRTTLINAGWKNIDKLMTVYKGFMVFGILFCLVMIMWLLSYRRYFKHKAKL